MATELAEEAALPVSPLEIQHLSGTEPSDAFGCFLGVVLGVAYKIAKKLLRRLFRTILFWLAIKDASEQASLTFHEGYLLRRGLADLDDSIAAPTEGARVRPELRRLRARIVAVCEETDTRPFQKLVKESLRGSTGALRRSARRVLHLLRINRQATEVEQQAAIEQELPDNLLERLTRQITAHSDYLRDLDRRWEE